MVKWQQIIGFYHIAKHGSFTIGYAFYIFGGRLALELYYMKPS